MPRCRKGSDDKAQQEGEPFLEEQGGLDDKMLVVPPPADLNQPAAHAEQPHHDDHSQVLSLLWTFPNLTPSLSLMSTFLVFLKYMPLNSLSVASWASSHLPIAQGRQT